MHAIKAYGEMKVYIHLFLTLAIGGGECSYSRSGRLIP